MPQPNKLRILKAIVQVVYVEDDGDTLTELVGAPLHISEATLDEFPQNIRRAVAERNTELATEGVAV